MKKIAKRILNRLAAAAGARLVSQRWGPRGHADGISRLLRAGFKIEQVWDVGASDGSWTMEMLPLLPNASFHLFEPHPNHTRELAALCAARPNLRFHDYGLGDSDSARELTLHGGQSSLLTSTQWQSDKASISVRRADAVVGHDGVTPPGLIKVDIQGAELMFLAGAQRVLSDCPFLLIEVSWLRLYDEAPYAEEVLQATSALGFHVYDICTYSQRRKDARLAQSDLLLAHTKTGLFDDVGW